MMKYKVGVIGRFGFGKTLLNGQVIKTKSIVSALADALGEENILQVDTYGGIKALLRLPFQCFGAAMQCENLVIMPAHKGIQIIAPLLAVMNLFFRRKLHYVVIGGWLNEMINGKPFLTWCLKRFHWIYPECTSMKQKLEAAGFANVVQMPNFKRIPVLRESELPVGGAHPLRLCIFSRVMREKGVDIAVAAVRAINQQMNRKVFCLDIYGQVDEHQIQWFSDLQAEFPEYIRYGGEIASDQSVPVLMHYDALLFPTKFYTEGIPGTIIDAYAAGVPVIASMWENYSDIISHETGIGYRFDDSLGLQSVLMSLCEDASVLGGMRHACLRRARDFMPEHVIPILLDRL